MCKAVTAFPFATSVPAQLHKLLTLPNSNGWNGVGSKIRMRPFAESAQKSR